MDEEVEMKEQRMSSTHVSVAKIGLLRIERAIGKAIHEESIQQSFSLCGIHPLDIYGMLDDCTTPFTDDQKGEFMRFSPKLEQEMRTRGEISDTLFDQLGLSMNFSAKDHLVLYRRRSCLLTHHAVIDREAKKREEAQAKVQEKKNKKASKSSALVLRILLNRTK
jgi:hypothetical protein